MILLIIILIVLFGGGGGFYGYDRWGAGGAGFGFLVPILVIVAIFYAFGLFPNRPTQ